MKSLRERLEEVCKASRIGILYAFGSRAREALQALAGPAAGFSSFEADLDIGIRMAPGRRPDIREKSGISVALEELFMVRRIDLVILCDVDPFLAANIIRGERLYCADPGEADEYELYVLRRAGDCAPLERERLALLERP